ncbi:MAG: hypothetical protein H7X80_01580, partial [bacterium]|nr:hypothetical protein [Candidatus Kapabacteria bacterium]
MKRIATTLLIAVSPVAIARAQIADSSALDSTAIAAVWSTTLHGDEIRTRSATSLVDALRWSRGFTQSEDGRLARRSDGVTGSQFYVDGMQYGDRFSPRSPGLANSFAPARSFMPTPS